MNNWFFWAYILFAVDRITKYTAHTYLSTQDYIFNTYVTGTYIINTGVSYGLFSPEKANHFWLLTGIIVLVTIILFFYWRRKKDVISALSVGLFLVNVGSFGNIVDRILYKGVVDWIYVHYTHYALPVFNCADVYICIGALLITFAYARD